MIKRNIIGVIKGDTRSLDYSSSDLCLVQLSVSLCRFQGEGLRFKPPKPLNRLGLLRFEGLVSTAAARLRKANPKAKLKFEPERFTGC